MMTASLVLLCIPGFAFGWWLAGKALP